MKKILFSLVALFVAINCWGYSTGQIVYNFITVSDTEGYNDLTMVYQISNASEGSLECKLVSITRTDETVVVPSTIVTEEKKTIKVVGTIRNNSYKENILPSTLKVLQFSENFKVMDADFLNSAPNLEKLIVPGSMTTMNMGSDGTALYPNLKKIEVTGSGPAKAVKTGTNSWGLTLDDENGATQLALICFKDESGNPITRLDIPEGVTTARYALTAGVATDYKQIKTIKLPSTFNYFEANTMHNMTAFEDLSYFTDYEVADGNTKFCAFDGILYETPVVHDREGDCGTSLVSVPCAKSFSNTNGVFYVHNGVKSVRTLAINKIRCTGLSLPGTLTTLDVAAVFGCNLLTQISIPESLTSIANGAFQRNQSLTDYLVDEENPNYRDIGGVLYTKYYETLISCPSAKTGDILVNGNTKTIGIGAFYGSRLSAITLPQGLEKLEESCFQNASNITYLFIPKTVKEIQMYAFYLCKELSTIEFEMTNNLENKSDYELKIHAWAFPGNKVENIIFPSHLTEFTESFQSRFKNVSFEEGSRLTTMAAFSANFSPYIESVDLSNCQQLTAIPDGCFQKQEHLNSVKLPKSITTLGSQSFFHTLALRTLDFEEGTLITEIKRNTFQECGIVELTIPDHVEIIGREAFQGCPNLTTVTIPASATNISTQAFKYCDKLTEFIVNENNGTYAASDCMLVSKTKRTLYIFPPGKANDTFTLISPSISNISNYAFYACKGLKNIVFPKKITSIGNYAFEFCDNLKDIYFLTEGNIPGLEDAVAADNAKDDPNSQDHRFGNATMDPAKFLEGVTIHIRETGKEQFDDNCYWKSCKKDVNSFFEKFSLAGKDNGNSLEFFKISGSEVAVVKSNSTNETAVVPATVENGGTTYNVSMIADYAFEDIPTSVKEIVFFGPVNYVGANAFNNGRYPGGSSSSPKSSIEQIIFANTDAVGVNELATKRFELGSEYGTGEYYEFVKDQKQKIYVAKSKLSAYKEKMEKWASKIDYKIPGIKISTNLGTFSREFDVDLSDINEGVHANWDDSQNKPKVIAYTTKVKEYEKDGKVVAIRVKSINCVAPGDENEDGDGDGTYIPANTGVLLQAIDGTTPDNFYYRIGESKNDYNKTFDAPSDNIMRSVVENGETIAPQDNYIFSGGTYKYLTQPKAMPVHKAYMHVEGINNTDGEPYSLRLIFNDEEEDVTGIEEIITNVDANVDAPIYNLQGQRVNGSVKGIVIKNGKKMYVK